MPIASKQFDKTFKTLRPLNVLLYMVHQFFVSCMSGPPYGGVIPPGYAGHHHGQQQQYEMAAYHQAMQHQQQQHWQAQQQPSQQPNGKSTY